MDIHDLHGLRDGASPRRLRRFNPFIHLSTDTPLMRMLFSITRPAGPEVKTAAKRVVRKKIVKAATLPSGSMVAYNKERGYDKPKPKP
jgi:hypothetical protein